MLECGSWSMLNIGTLSANIDMWEGVDTGMCVRVCPLLPHPAMMKAIGK
jgi:hypothetical protein